MEALDRSGRTEEQLLSRMVNEGGAAPYKARNGAAVGDTRLTEVHGLAMAEYVQCRYHYED